MRWSGTPWRAVKAAGGKVLGTVRAPLGTADFSSYLVQAQASGAKVIGLANAGTDTQNCIKQAAEFGLTKNGTKIATLLMQISDVNSLGQKVCAGLNYTDSFYWDMTDKTRAWSKRWGDKMGGMVPGLLHAGSYCAATHWLKAVKAVGIDRCRRGGGEDEGDAGERFLQRQREDPRGRAGDARDVSVAGEAGLRKRSISTISAPSWRRSPRPTRGVR